MKLSTWFLRQLAFLHVFMTDRLFRTSRPYFVGPDFVSLNRYHLSACGLLNLRISRGERFVCGALPCFPPQPVGRLFLLAAIGAVLRESKLIVRLQNRVSFSRMAKS